MIVDNIRRLCSEQGVSFYRIEKDTGIGNGVIARWDTSSPSVDRLKKVADYLSVTVDDLLEDRRENHTQ